MKGSNRYLLTGGGTAGHVYPALALAEFIREHEPEAKFLYVGARGGAEERIVTSMGYDLTTFPVKGLPTAWAPFRLAGVIVQLAGAILQALRIFFRFRPHVVLGTGGYASAPVLLTGLLLRSLRLWRGVMTLHEQNILPGRFNKWMSKWADFIGTSFPETVAHLTGRRVFWTGYPVRQEIVSPMQEVPGLREQTRRDFGIAQNARVVLIFGGSSGARTINRAVLQALPFWIKHEDLYVFHATGLAQGNYDPEREIQEAISRIPLVEDVHQRYRWQPYFHDIQIFYRMADLVVCRAGAGTVWEIATMGIPALVIPKANLPGDHQVKNARFLERIGLARVVYERRDPSSLAGEPERVDPGEFNRLLLSMLDDPDLLAGIRDRAQRLQIPDGRRRFFEVLQHVRGANSGPVPKNLNLVPSHETTGGQRGMLRLEWWGIRKLLMFLEDQWRKSNELSEEDRRYVEYRADQLLASFRWQERNAGVKLAGLIRYERRLPALLHCVTDRTPASWAQRIIGGDLVQVGFIRRNAVQALWRIRRYDAEVRRALLIALTDPYYEARSWAARAAERLADCIGQDPEFENLLRQSLKDRWFEVVSSSLDALGKVATDPAILSDIEALLESSNGKIQHAALRCLMHLVERDVVHLSTDTQRRMNRIPMRGVEFSPQFPLKTTWEAFQRVLSQKNASSERHEEDIHEFEKQQI